MQIFIFFFLWTEKRKDNSENSFSEQSPLLIYLIGKPCLDTCMWHIILLKVFPHCQGVYCKNMCIQRRLEREDHTYVMVMKCFYSLELRMQSFNVSVSRKLPTYLEIKKIKQYKIVFEVTSTQVTLKSKHKCIVIFLLTLATFSSWSFLKVATLV